MIKIDGKKTHTVGIISIIINTYLFFYGYEISMLFYAFSIEAIALIMTMRDSERKLNNVQEKLFKNSELNRIKRFY